MIEDHESKSQKFITKIWKKNKKKQFEPMPSTSSMDIYSNSSEFSSKENISLVERKPSKMDVNKISSKLPDRRRTVSESFEQSKHERDIIQLRRAFSMTLVNDVDVISLKPPHTDGTSCNKENKLTIPAIILTCDSTEALNRSSDKLIDIFNDSSRSNLHDLSDTAEVNRSSDRLIIETNSREDLNRISVVDDTVQEFRSLPNLSAVDTCVKCKNVSRSRKCWDVFTDWCRFPRMKCACMDTNSYERLPNVGGLLALSALVGSEDKDNSTEKQEELLFYNDDGSYQTVVVERNLCASDLCQLLALKNRVSKDVNWTIVEHWVDLGLERLLEDHEDVLSAHRDMENYSRHAECRFVFRKDFRKYEFFHHPQQFFPADMIDIEHCDDYLGSGAYNSTALQNLVAMEGQCPSVFSHVWIQDPNKQVWAKGFLLLRDKKLYLSYKVQVVAKFLRSGKQRDSNYFPVSEADAGQLSVFARLSDYHVYTTLNAKNQFRAPTEWGICLRPSGADGAGDGGLDDDTGPGLRCLACDSERARTCWLTAMRLAKYGKQLRENYRAFKNKQVESINPKEYNSYTVPNESVRSRVAMDFTGSVGRIVDDPKEAKAIAAAEGYSWRRRWRPSTRVPAHSPIPQGIESGVHITQPWFHSGMSRDQAAALVTRYGTVDGVFLVRDSRSSPGAFVLTYRCGGKVLHTQITPILDPVREAHVFSLDNGFTKFYDLLQLVEFYQLNAGVLPTRLTHYVVQSPTGVTVPPNNVAHPSVAGSF